MKWFLVCWCAVLILPAFAQENADEHNSHEQSSHEQSLQQLLIRLKQERAAQKEAWRVREQRFLTEQKKQQAKLEQARLEKLKQEQSLEPLQSEMKALSTDVAELEQTIAEQGKQLRALQGAFSRIAGEAGASLEQSLVHCSIPIGPYRSNIWLRCRICPPSTIWSHCGC